MSSDRFDKILKRNLESVRPEYEQRAWDRFSKRLPASGFFPWLQKYGGWALCAMMLAGWVTTLYTLRENQELIRNLVTEKGNSGSLTRYGNAKEPPSGDEEPLANADQSALHARRIDTVYVIRKIVTEHRNHEPDVSVMQSLSRRKGQPEKGYDLTSARNTRSENNSHEAPLHSKTETEQKNNVPGLSEVREDMRTETAGEVRSDVQAVYPNTPAAHYGQLVHADSADKAIDKETIIALIDSAWAEQVVKQRLSNAHVDSLLDRYPYALQRPAQIRPKRPPLSLAMLQPRFGIESLLTPYSYGLGPSVEFFPTENLGVSVGIQASTLRAENHKKLRDYNSATGKLFVVQYSSYLPSRFDRIEDISIKTSVISLPISLKYYIPLKSSLSLFVQSGTSLDLSAYQRVDFESYLNRSKRRNTFETDAKPNLFHNFMFGAGVQYRKSRILAQLSPYYVYDFRNIENTPSGSNLGLRASVWLNLFK